MRKKILLAYIAVLIFWILFLLTGYSFSWGFLNFLLIGIIVIYPILMFFLSELTIGTKIFVSILALTIVVVVGFYLLPLVAFGSSKVTVVKKWHSRGYIVTLTRRLDWAGPPYYRYGLSRTKFFGLIHKDIDYSYPGTSLNTSCKVSFSEWNSGKTTLIEFNKCSNSIIMTK